MRVPGRNRQLRVDSRRCAAAGWTAPVSSSRGERRPGEWLSGSITPMGDMIRFVRSPHATAVLPWSCSALPRVGFDVWPFGGRAAPADAHRRSLGCSPICRQERSFVGMPARGTLRPVHPPVGPLLKAVRRRCCRPRRGCCGPSPGGVDLTRAATPGVPRWRAGGRTADRDHWRQRSAVAGGAPGPAWADRVPGSCLVGGRPGCCRGGPGAGGVRRCCGSAVGGFAATGRDHGGHGVRAGRPASHGGSRAAGPASGAVMVTPSSRAARAARPAGHSPIGRSGEVRIQSPTTGRGCAKTCAGGVPESPDVRCDHGVRSASINGSRCVDPAEMDVRPGAAMGVRCHRTRCGRALGFTGTRPRGLRHLCSRRQAVRGRSPSVLPTRCRPPVPVPGRAGRGPRPGHGGVGEPDDRSGGSELGSERRGR